MLFFIVSYQYLPLSSQLQVVLLRPEKFRILPFLFRMDLSSLTAHRNSGTEYPSDPSCILNNIAAYSSLIRRVRTRYVRCQYVSLFCDGTYINPGFTRANDAPALNAGR